MSNAIRIRQSVVILDWKWCYTDVSYVNCLAFCSECIGHIPHAFFWLIVLVLTQLNLWTMICKELMSVKYVFYCYFLKLEYFHFFRWFALKSIPNNNEMNEQPDTKLECNWKKCIQSRQYSGFFFSCLLGVCTEARNIL